MLQDLRFAMRAFSRQRGFAAVAVLTIALGVAMTTTIFSVADNILYRPLPYPQPERLYEIFGANKGDTASRVSGAVGDYLAWRQTDVFSSIGVFRYASFAALTGGREARRVLSVPIDELFLPTLGAQPALGRGFTADDCREGARPVVLISASLWRSDFGSEPGVIGRIIDIDNAPAEIVGVLPADFLFPASVLATRAQRIELVRPLAIPAGQRQDHNIRGYRAIGRLAPGVSIADAQARLDALQQSMRPLYRPSRVIPGAFDGVRILPLQASMTGTTTRFAVLFLLIAAFAVLFVACVNVANMLLARGADRERELAVRAAIGASRGRLVRLLLIEALTLSIAGGVMGFVLARTAFGAVLTQLPQRLVALRPPEMNVRVALFAFAIAVAVGVIFGLLPAIRQSRTDFTAAMKHAGQTSTRHSGWTRDALVFAEIALAVMLVGSGALVLRSFANVLRVDPGMDPQRVLTLQLTPPARMGRTASAERAMLFRNALEAVRAVPGVQAAALTDNLLLTGGYAGSSLSLDGIDSKRLYTRGNNVTEVHVTPDYFRVMGIAIVKGAAFPSDTRGDESIAITSARVGRFAGVDPLGRDIVSLMKDERGQQSPQRYRVVGVAAEVHDRGLDSDPVSIFYLPFKGSGQAIVVVRAENPAALAADIGQAIHALEPTAVVDQVGTLDDLVYRSLAERRFNAFLYGAFSISALVLSAIGVYGVVAYSISRRTREIGIRVALGATTQRVVTAVTGRTMTIVGAGLTTGVAGLFALKNVLRSFVFNLEPNDPSTILGATIVLVLAAAAAAFVPARRAARVDAMIALRAE
ncbi:MAG TPA: ABC transporter permease [Vicinamibacterales bacterium]|nr:ABC transporter permease [Vicinamibacterales bacterium]